MPPSIRERIAALLDKDGTLSATDIAMTLIDEDVDAGDYHGDTQIDIAASEYIAEADRAITERTPA